MDGSGRGPVLVGELIYSQSPMPNIQFGRYRSSSSSPFSESNRTWTAHHTTTTSLLNASPTSVTSPPSVNTSSSSSSSASNPSKSKRSNGIGASISLGKKKSSNQPQRLLPGEQIIIHIRGSIAMFSQGVWTLGTLFITNFQVIFKHPSTVETSVSLMSIESVKKKLMTPEHLQMKLKCKDFRAMRFTFEDSKEFERCHSYLTKWQDLGSVEETFAFSFKMPVSSSLDGWKNYSDHSSDFERMGIYQSGNHNSPNSLSNCWRITNINSSYLLCDSYPQKICVPVGISGEELLSAAKFRQRGRIPVLVWTRPSDKNPGTKGKTDPGSESPSIVRSSQPRTGFTGNRCAEDEKLIQLIAQSSPSKKLCIVDARPKANAMANAVTGGGYENVSLHYESCSMTFASIPNVHVMFDSWKKMFSLLHRGQIEENHWFSSLEQTQWLNHILLLISSSLQIVETIEKEETSVLIHCTDGWDRTPQLSSLSQILLDPYYRTIHGFIVLLEKDWLSFGHRFCERSFGHRDPKQKSTGFQAPPSFSPILMQFIDCVYQVTVQFPDSFEFNEAFLRFVLDSYYSCQYGTFLGNSDRERKDLHLPSRTVSLWTVIHSNKDPYLNRLYEASTGTRRVLYPSCKMRDMLFWEECYARPFRGNSTVEDPCSTVGSSSPSRFRDHVIRAIKKKDEEIKKLQEEIAAIRFEHNKAAHQKCFDILMMNPPPQKEIEEKDNCNYDTPEISSSNSNHSITQETRSTTSPRTILESSDSSPSNSISPSSSSSVYDSVRSMVSEWIVEKALLSLSKRHVHHEGGSKNRRVDETSPSSEFSSPPPARKGRSIVRARSQSLSDSPTKIHFGTAATPITPVTPTGATFRMSPLDGYSHFQNYSPRKSPRNSRTSDGTSSSPIAGQKEHPIVTVYHDDSLTEKSSSERRTDRSRAYSTTPIPDIPPDHPIFPGMNANNGEGKEVLPSDHHEKTSLRSSTDKEKVSNISTTPTNSTSITTRSSSTSLLSVLDPWRKERQNSHQLHHDTHHVTPGPNFRSSTVPYDIPNHHLRPRHGSFDTKRGSRRDSSSDFHREEGEMAGSFWLSKAPIWVPDEEAHNCRLCDVSFSRFRRKHHCRNCGNIFCSSCCNQKLPIQRFGFVKPVLVCEACVSRIRPA
eukprot:TRINITY_DN2770_c0_g1_i5.p1 TRINITY_DN2770_c0_g1~~TRINITY_DN2770_c0_g1_i5.p1  ORF type:complete len:1148 (-),score=226.16 TRINITY_DN2770_c0_g1_i5:60-3503(-)